MSRNSHVSAETCACNHAEDTSVGVLDLVCAGPTSCWQQRVPRHMHVLLTVRNSRALSSSFSSRMRLNVGMTLLHVPDHAENTSTTAQHEVAKCHVGRATPSGPAWSGAHVPRPHLSSLWTQAWPLATRRCQCYTARGAVLAPRPFLVCTAVNCNYAWRERCVMNVLRLRTQDATQENLQCGRGHL